MTAAELRAAAEQAIARAVAAQGLPAQLTDPQVIARAVALIRTAPDLQERAA